MGNNIYIILKDGDVLNCFDNIETARVYLRFLWDIYTKDHWKYVEFDRHLYGNLVVREDNERNKVDNKYKIIQKELHTGKNFLGFNDAIECDKTI